jgi:predicted ArsR family transcriptional regulator
MTGMQEQARALGDPTRHAIFRRIAESRAPVSVRELTDRFELNHNAVRQHLAKLVVAGLVVEERAAPSGPGRPRLLYSVDPAAESRWGVTGPYERLSLLLTEMIRTGETPVEVGRRAGRRSAADHAEADPGAALVRVTANGGFEPTLLQQGADVEVLLHACPFAAAAQADPDIVCALHHGIAIGVAEQVGGITIDGLDREDPRRQPCRLRAHLDTLAPGRAPGDSPTTEEGQGR